MPSHFSDIGFVIESVQQFAELADRAANEGVAIPTAGGYYIHWSPGQGVELWVQCDTEQQIIGCNPHFVGPGRTMLGV